jgi:hypothetical protein
MEAYVYIHRGWKNNNKALGSPATLLTYVSAQQELPRVKHIG